MTNMFVYTCGVQTTKDCINQNTLKANIQTFKCANMHKKKLIDSVWYDLKKEKKYLSK